MSEIVARTHKEEVADDVANHLLVEVAIVDVLPVRVLQVEYNNITKGTRDPSKEPNAHSEKPGKPMIGPGFEQIMK